MPKPEGVGNGKNGPGTPPETTVPEGFVVKDLSVSSNITPLERYDDYLRPITLDSITGLDATQELFLLGDGGGQFFDDGIDGDWLTEYLLPIGNDDSFVVINNFKKGEDLLGVPDGDYATVDGGIYTDEFGSFDRYQLVFLVETRKFRGQTTAAYEFLAAVDTGNQSLSESDFFVVA